MALQSQGDGTLSTVASTASPAVTPRWPFLQTTLKVSVLALALLLVLIPGNRVSPWAYPVLFGVPLVWAAIRRGAERAFLLWTMYVLSFVTFVVLRRVADNTGLPWLHRYVIEIDRMLGAGVLPTAYFQRLWYSADLPGFLDTATIGLHLSYYLVPPAAGMLFWYLNQVVFERYVLAICMSYLAGLLVHFAVPTVPPWMAGQLGHIEPVARVLYDGLHGFSPAFLRFGDMVAGGNAVAAMPSLHMATAFLVALGLGRTGRLAGAVGILYAIAMGFALVYMGEHYVADLLGGILLAWICWRAAPYALAWGPTGAAAALGRIGLLREGRVK